MNEVVELFCMHAFRKSSPPEGYEHLSHRAIHYASCLPLALKVLGSFFHGRKLGVWESALDRLGKASNDKILETLKLSFDGLDVYEKQIFLDISCFYKGKDEEHVIRVLDSFGFDPLIGISVLIEKSLINVSNKRIDMHDLIQEMGWHIVRERFPDSRLWQLEQIHNFIKGNKQKREVVEAIMLMENEYHVDDYDTKLGLSTHDFEKMEKLRVLDIDRKFTSTEPTSLPAELRWLRWNEYPFSTLPLADRCKLVGLEMAKGVINSLWNNQKILPQLKFIHLERLRNLTSFPDISGAPNVEKVIVSDCRRLVEVHESLGYHRGIVHLEMNGCSRLKCLPSRLEMDSLETLILSGCSSLERFPEVSPCMVKLSQINLYSCYEITELPSSIGYLSSLSLLNLTDCSNLEKIPDSICELKYLKCLHLHNCMELKTFPKNLESMKMLEEIWLGFTYQNRRPETLVYFSSLTSLSSLKKLNLSGRQIGEQSFPKNHDAFCTLEELYLSGNSKLVHLPSIIYRLSSIKLLELNNCSKLVSLCELPSSIQVLKANDCVSLKNIGDVSKAGEWLYKIWLINCHKLLEDEENQLYLDEMLQLSFIKKCVAINHRLSITVPGSKIPSWIKETKPSCRIALKLPHEWQTQIMGFVVCGVFQGKIRSQHAFPRVIFRIVSGGKVIPKSEVNRMQYRIETTEDGGNVWISYMSLGLFQKMYQDLQPEDWSNIKGNLEITVMLTDGTQSVRCGAHLIHKKDVQEITTHISDYGNMVYVDDEDLGYEKIISGNTYVYEEKSDEKNLMPLRNRISTRRSTKSISLAFTTTAEQGSDDDDDDDL